MINITNNTLPDETSGMETKRFSRIKWFPVSCVLVAIVIAIIILYSEFVPPYILQLKLRQCETIIPDIRSGKLRPNVYGDITLPKNMSSLTANGHIYVVSGSHKPLKVIFPTEIENYQVVEPDEIHAETFTNVSGYLYSDDPLSKKEWFDINIPHCRVNSVAYWEGSAVRPHWYDVYPYISD